VLREAGYPLLRFRTLEGWNHWPTDYNSKVPHLAQQLAWCEGMTAEDPDRLAASFAFLADCRVKEHTDHAAVHSLAARIAGLEAAPGALKERAEAARKAVAKLAEAHGAALKPPKDRAFDGGAWIGQLPMFLRGFRGVPACDELAKEWDPVLKQHADAAIPHLRAYHAALQKGADGEAFAEGVAAIREGFLHFECVDAEFLKALARLRKEGKSLPKDAVKDYERLVPDFEKALKEGEREYLKVNGKAGKY
jgi:hypothetical protein